MYVCMSVVPLYETRTHIDIDIDIDWSFLVEECIARM